MSVFIIEGQSDDRLLKHHPVLVGHLLFLLLPQYFFRAVCQCAEDIRHLAGCLHGLGDALVVHIAPLSEPLAAAHIPAELTFVGRRFPAHHAQDEGSVRVLVVGMYQSETLLIIHTFFRQQMAMHVDGMPLGYIQFQYIALTPVQRVLHDGRYLAALAHAHSDAHEHQSVDGPGYQEGYAHDHHHQHRYSVGHGESEAIDM